MKLSTAAATILFGLAIDPSHAAKNVDLQVQATNIHKNDVEMPSAGIRKLALTFDEAEARCDEVMEQRMAETSTLICECMPIDNDADFILSCFDSCFHCDSTKVMVVNEDPVIYSVEQSAICARHEEEVVFPVNREVPFVESSTVTVQYEQGRDELLTYVVETAADDSVACTAQIDGTTCTSCTIGTCGEPTIDCSNVVPGAVIDLCAGDEVSIDNIMAGFHLTSDKWTCTSSSMTACYMNGQENEELYTGLACECTAFFENANLYCDSECGEFCNDDLTFCGTRRLSSNYDGVGKLERKFRYFDITRSPNDDYTGEEWQYGYSDSARTPSCYMTVYYDNEPLDGCSSCEVQTCADGSLKPLLDCSIAEFGLPVLDVCDENLQVSTGALQFLSVGKFNVCTSSDVFIPSILPLVDYGSTPPVNRFPLARCEGDCDGDADCDIGLFCFQRGRGDDVPGCTGGLRSRTDFCVSEESGVLPLMDLGGSPDFSHFPLQRCEGDCDRDDDCDFGLVCFQRNRGTPIPGCNGALTSRSDFCVEASMMPNARKLLETDDSIEKKSFLRQSD